MTKKKEVKPVYLFTDTNKQNALIKAYEDKLMSLNDLIVQIEKVQGKPLEEPEIKQLIADPKKFVEEVKNEIRKTFPFPKASESKNLELLGIDWIFVNGILTVLSPEKFKYDIKNLSLISSQKERARLIKSARIYTSNEKQIIVLNELKKICDAMNVLIENGTFKNSMTFHMIKKVSSMLILNEGTKRMIVNYPRLLQIK